MSASAGPADLDWEEQRARIRRMLDEADRMAAERSKLFAEQSKFTAEQNKLMSEQAKFSAEAGAGSRPRRSSSAAWRPARRSLAQAPLSSS